MTILRRIALTIAALLTVAPALVAAESSRFNPSTHKSGELRFVEGLPVVTVGGSPEEMGEQLGTLLKKPLGELMRKQDDFARGLGLGANARDAIKSGLGRTGGWLFTSAFPEAYLRELRATSKAAAIDANILTIGNVMYELAQFPACSTLGVEPARSATGGTLMGRNLDFPTFGFLDKYGVVVVYRPTGKRAFASITYPGFVGVFSGMNDAGLCVAQLEVNRSAEPTPRVNLGGTPVAMCFRRLLEECSTIDEAEKLLREQKRLIMCNLAICDREQAAVLEITPKSVVRRTADRGLCPCTNHFRTEKFAVGVNCPRYSKLSAAWKLDKLSVKDVGRLLDAVNQGDRTLQTMVFEPESLRLHLSLGPPPSSSRPLKPLELAKWLTEAGTNNSFD